jgi:MFS family permease
MNLLVRPRIHRFLFAEAFDILGTNLFMMALPWLMLTMGFAGTHVALVALACTVLSFALTPVFATLVDRHSRKAILVATQIAKTLAAAVLLGFVLLGQLNFVVMVLVQVVFWLCGNFAWAASGAFQQENNRPEEYTQLSSYLEIVMQTSTLSSAALGLFLLERWSVTGFAAFALVTTSVAALSYASIPYSRKARNGEAKSFVGDLIASREIVLARPQFILFLTLSCLSYPMLTYLGKLIPILFSGLGYSGSWTASWTLLYGFGALLIGLSVRSILASFAHARVMMFTMYAMTIVLFVMSMLANSPLLLVFFFIIGLLAPLNRIARTVWMNMEVNTHERGRIDGILSLFSTAAQSVSYLLIAVLSAFERLEWGFAAFGLLMLCSAMIMQRNAKPSRATQAEGNVVVVAS